MVYDEGFNIEFGDFSFFAFSKYSVDSGIPGKTIYNSHCYSTLIGWYSNKDKTKWGCYKAQKANTDFNKVTFSDVKNTVQIVQPKFEANNNQNFFSDSISFLSKKVNLKTDAQLKIHSQYHDKLKKIKKSWESTLYPEFHTMTSYKLNRIAGIPRNAIPITINKAPQSPVTIMQKMFPSKFDHMNLIRPSGSQGDCGSCYAYATTRMIEARLKLNYNHDVSLSVQHSLDCSFYNQGCQGGYPFLVMKYISEFEMVPESCHPYTVIILNYI